MINTHDTSLSATQHERIKERVVNRWNGAVHFDALDDLIREVINLRIENQKLKIIFGDIEIACQEVRELN
tara:strand:+ start:317 stop:526 length:210 start_codon:yes stop_codon:yes gene_type:complete